MIGDVLDKDADEELLRAAVPAEFHLKLQAEATWPTTTDCDRLDEAFAELNDSGVIALHDTGMTMSDGLEDVDQSLVERDESAFKGFCFYHGQDTERAVKGGGLRIAFGSLEGGSGRKQAVGVQIKACLEPHGFDVAWDGDPDRRMEIQKFDWKRRGRLEKE